MDSGSDSGSDTYPEAYDAQGRERRPGSARFLVQDDANGKAT